LARLLLTRHTVSHQLQLLRFLAQRAIETAHRQEGVAENASVDALLFAHLAAVDHAEDAVSERDERHDAAQDAVVADLLGYQAVRVARNAEGYDADLQVGEAAEHAVLERAAHCQSASKVGGLLRTNTTTAPLAVTQQRPSHTARRVRHDETVSNVRRPY